MARMWERWGSALGVAAIVCWVVTFVLAGSSPDTSDANAKIVAWYASSSHQRNQIIAFLIFGVGLMCLFGFLAVLRARLSAVEGAPFRLSTLVFGAGVASAVFWALGGIMFSAPAFTAADTGATDVLPSTYRMIQNAGYITWVAAAAVGSVVVWAASALILRGAALPRWFGWFGILAGVLQLFGVFFIPLFVFWLWVLMASVLLTFRGSEIGERDRGGEGVAVSERPLP